MSQHHGHILKIVLTPNTGVKVEFNLSYNFHVFSNICNKSLTLDKKLTLLVNEANFLSPALTHQVFKQAGLPHFHSQMPMLQAVLSIRRE